jgi:hypothetical protein
MVGVADLKYELNSASIEDSFKLRRNHTTIQQRRQNGIGIYPYVLGMIGLY